MKKIFILAIATLSFMACQNEKTSENTDSGVMDSSQVASSAVSAEDAAKITFEREVFDFGKVNEGEHVTHAFKFKNTGKTPLIISNATATCGCTVPEVSKEPILPGGESEIKVVFNTEAKFGLQDKVITITSNAAPQQVEVHLIGEVIKKK